jgi:stress response protein YsnF
MAKQGLVTEINSNSPVEPGKEEIMADKHRPSIPVVEEKAVVSTEVVDVSKVRLSKTVENGIDSLDVTTSQEEVIVKRVPKNIIVDTAPEGVRYEGDVMIIPVLKEVAVVEKKLMLVEEIHISRQTHHTTKKVDVPVRKEKVDIERTPITNRPPDR